ncbi:ABC transporter permease subunit [Leifsonia sp. H3M29-4]|uniref:ABC transporter permease n=1 Tax=Salinibacterium metalliresistens TaxID=3031321 RepID=UPI0023DB0FF2|nr:ABC transporter permease subunit [Salinibacterium metalliresistens]MDF1479504.1 ABC transporter permease subunit [Salinibacterium metalliresistens]
MATFVVRRLIASIFIFIAATYLMYVLTAFAGDPLEDLRTGNAPNKLELIEARTRLLNLDVPVFLRYFIWLGGIFGLTGKGFDLGVTVQNQPVTVLLAQAAGSTLQLVTLASLIAIILGVIVGITTALRQYSGYDYGVTFLSFLFFSLPIFWVAVLLKQYLAIGFNDFLRDPHIEWWVIVALAILAGLIWGSIIPGSLRRKAITFGIATLATGGVLAYIELSDWFKYPHIGLPGVAVTAIGIAFGVTAISTGLRRKQALRASLVVAGIGIAIYFPFMAWLSFYLDFWTFILLAVATVAISFGIGWFMGGDDRMPVARTAAIVGFLVGGIIALDRFMQVWDDYAASGRIKGRPIATIGSQTPGLEGSLWVHGIDFFTHLLLPTVALILISFASYTRYSRASLLEVMNQDYIRTARAKGLTERTVVVRHAFRNALIPIATIVAFDIGGIIGGAVITERVFGWTGMGALFQNGLDHVDPNPVMAFFLVTGGLAILFNLIADLVYAGLDPRIRVS